MKLKMRIEFGLSRYYYLYNGKLSWRHGRLATSSCDKFISRVPFFFDGLSPVALIRRHVFLPRFPSALSSLWFSRPVGAYNSVSEFSVRSTHAAPLDGREIPIFFLLLYFDSIFRSIYLHWFDSAFPVACLLISEIFSHWFLWSRV
jgi:hypothetical protein